MPTQYTSRVLEHKPSAAYIMSVLARDWHALARPLAREFENVRGSIETFVPAASTTAATLDFKTGGVTRTAISQKWIADLTEEFLRGSADRLLLAQEPLLQRGDRVHDWERPLVHYFGTDIYYVCTSQTPHERIEDVYRFATALPWSLAILTSLPIAQHSRLRDAEAIEEADLLTLCHRANAIIVGGVYDAEGYLVWKRED